MSFAVMALSLECQVICIYTVVCRHDLKVFYDEHLQSLPVILPLLCVCRWDHYSTTGQPPLGVRAYANYGIGHYIYFFAGYCGHDSCRHNSVNVLNVDDFTWKELFPTSDFGPMRKSDCGMLAFHSQLLVVGGAGATYKEHNSYIYTNELHFYDREEG